MKKKEKLGEKISDSENQNVSKLKMIVPMIGLVILTWIKIINAYHAFFLKRGFGNMYFIMIKDKPGQKSTSNIFKSSKR